MHVCLFSPCHIKWRNPYQHRLFPRRLCSFENVIGLDIRKKSVAKLNVNHRAEGPFRQPASSAQPRSLLERRIPHNQDHHLGCSNNAAMPPGAANAIMQDAAFFRAHGTVPTLQPSEWNSPTVVGSPISPAHCINIDSADSQNESRDLNPGTSQAREPTSSKKSQNKQAWR